MFKSYINAANALVAQKLYTTINVVGLAVGLACFILIALFVHHELTYDNGWGNADRIYRISRDYFASAKQAEAHPAGMAAPAAPLLKQDFPQIEKAARIFCCGAIIKTPSGDSFLDGGYAEADNELFDIFDFKWLRGDPATALKEPYDVVLTSSAARRFFGDRDPMGQTLLVGGPGNGVARRVVGVIEDPRHTHLDFDMLGSLVSWTTSEGAKRFFNDWHNDVFYTYVLLKGGAEIDEIQGQAGEFFDRHLGEGASRYTSFTATPIGDIHLRSDRDSELWLRKSESAAQGSSSTVFAFSAIAVFIVLIACANFINLTTARSVRRAKQVAVHKVFGAGRIRMVFQFLTESMFLSLIAVFLAVVLVEIALPAFNGFLNQHLTFDYLSNPRAAGALLLLALITGIVAGAYPSFYLSAFQPARVLRGDTTRGPAGAAFRKTLVVLQFSISIALIVATAIVYLQMRYVGGFDLGFDKDEIVVVAPNGAGGEKWETLKHEWLENPRIANVTKSDAIPFEVNPKTAEVRIEGGQSPARRIPLIRVDYDFFETYGIRVVTGRTFSKELGDRLAPVGGETESRAVPYVISELAAAQLGLTPQQAIGKRLELGAIQGNRFRIDAAGGPIVGVVGDAYYESARDLIAPAVYELSAAGTYVSLKISGRNPAATLGYIDEKWKALQPDFPFNRHFLDQDFEALYQTERHQQQMLTIFGALAVLVACLGLFGLASFATERRAKEIGIRKALGGSVWDMIRLFTGEFAKLMLLANLVAWPVAYFLMRRWLASFAYRIDVGLWVYFVSGLLALTIALLTVAAVVVWTASARPIDSLRHE